MLLEEHNYRAARNQFKAAARADPGHLPVWQAWAVMEGTLGNIEEARKLFQRGVWAAPKNPDIVYLWQVRARGIVLSNIRKIVPRKPEFVIAQGA